MKLKIRFADQIVGLFVLCAIAALCGILILLGANQRWFAKDFYFTSEFKSGQGLREGMPISLRGFQIGAVDDVILQDDNNVGIRFHIYDTYYEKVTLNSVLELAVSPIGLGGGLYFHPGKPTGELITEGEKIPSLDFAEGKKLVKMKLTEIPAGGDAITSILNSIDPLLANVNSLVITLNETLESINQSLAGDKTTPVGEILDEVAILTVSINSLIAEITGSITSTLSNVDSITGEVYSITGNVDNITGNLDTMTADPTGLVVDLLAPKGSIATILDDDNQLFNQINDILDQINLALAQLQQFTVYLNDTQPQITGILDQGQDALEKGKEVLEGLSNNPILRGGITQQEEQGSTFQGYRDEDF